MLQTAKIIFVIFESIPTDRVVMYASIGPCWIIDDVIEQSAITHLRATHPNDWITTFSKIDYCELFEAILLHHASTHIIRVVGTKIHAMKLATVASHNKIVVEQVT